MAIERPPVFDYVVCSEQINKLLEHMQGNEPRTSTIGFESHGYRPGNRGLLVIRDGEDDPTWTVEFCVAPAWLEISEDEFGEVCTKWAYASARVPERVTLVQKAAALYVLARLLDGVDIDTAWDELVARRKDCRGR